ncbi:muscarinic acetylcholine receptor M1 [Python bivittatus]|uniref:Muscarinic acetylcholine receptor n=1 Tax=Python bivittatus TaxID=176946 RepID=A0A9F5MYH6_PYTBI|nr:muscarinic acetylcholine receptor M1 [Python bivittatus]
MNFSDTSPTPSGKLESPTSVPESGHPLWEAVLIVLLSGSLSLITVVGNLLVMVAFKVNRELRTVHNYFLLSLAGADLIIGSISMNLYTTYIVMGRWAMGNLACDLWLCLDYVASNASVMNLLIISLDRYFSVTRPLTYRAKRTPRKAAIMIGLAWLISFVLWAPAILFWQNLVGERMVPEGVCQIQFFSEPIITFGTAIAAFYLPVTIMAILYWKIYKETQKRAKDLPGLQGLGFRTNQPLGLPPTSSRAEASGNSNPCPPLALLADGVAFPQQACCFLGRGAKGAPLDQSSNSSWNTTEEEEGGNVSTDSLTSSEGEEQAFDVHAICPAAIVHLPMIDAVMHPLQRAQCCDAQVRVGRDWVAGKVMMGTPKQALAGDKRLQEAVGSPWTEQTQLKATRRILRRKRRHLFPKRKPFLAAKERKAARMLSAILLAFIITWTPYNIMVLVSTFCAGCIPESLWRLGYWLCYVNSTINPMCYALCNRSFRTTFRQLLQGRWWHGASGSRGER